MKNFSLLTTLIIGGLLLTGCFEKDLPLEGECKLGETCKLEEIKDDYVPIEERTKSLKENPWDWVNKEDVYNREWLKTIDTGFGVYPYGNFSSKNRDNLIFFESTSEDGTISRFAIYDRENYKWLFDCFDGGGGGYIEADKSIDIDTIDVMSCKEKYEEVVNYLENENNKNQDMNTEIIVPRTPNVDVITIHTGCNNYINKEFGFQINLNKWSNDCKIEYEQRYDWNNEIIGKDFKLWALPTNDYGWFESRGDFEQILIVSHNQELDENELGYLSYLTENNKYKFYRVGGSASPSFYYTYFPVSYNDFICEGAHKDNDGNLVDNNGCYCDEDNSYWKSINIDMPNPARNIGCVTQALIRESFSVFNI